MIGLLIVLAFLVSIAFFVVAIMTWIVGLDEATDIMIEAYGGNPKDRKR